MKLVEILAAEMEEWPDGVTHLTQSSVDREIYNALDGKDEDSLTSLDPRFDTIKSHNEGNYPIVTRAQWQAERDRQKGGEWKRHRGGKCPVDSQTVVEIRQRNGDIEKFTANGFMWDHNGQKDDIMSYRVISQPQAEEVEVNIPNAKTVEAMDASDRGEGRKFNSAQDLYAALDITSKAKTDQIDGPIKWRDTVNELDAYIEEFTREREALINRLALEGFALIPAMTAVMGVADVDMSDWRNWKSGDIVECLTDSYSGVYTKGQQYKVKSVNRDDFYVFDDLGEQSSCVWDDADCDGFKFVSRP